MAESFAVSGIEATGANLSPAGMPPCPTPSPLKLRALARVLADLSITLRAEKPPFWFQVGGSRVPNGAQGGEAPRGSGGCKPHAWERHRRGGDRWGCRVQPPLGAY